MRLEYELAYYDSAVHRFNQYTTRTPPIIECRYLPCSSHVTLFRCISLWLYRGILTLSHIVSQARPRQWNMQLPPSLEWHIWPGRRSIYNTCMNVHTLCIWVYLLICVCICMCRAAIFFSSNSNNIVACLVQVCYFIMLYFILALIIAVTSFWWFLISYESF